MNFELSINNIGKKIGRKRIVRNITLKISPGEIVALLGPNGSGKSTSFDIISGISIPDYGSIELNGYDITHLPLYRRARLGVGYLPQSSSIFTSLTVLENLLIALEHSKKNYKNRFSIVDKLITEFGLEGIRNSKGEVLSGGERKRTEIARILATQPKYILFDEPFSGIDPITINELCFIFEKLKESGIGILMTDHNIHATLPIVDRGYILNAGTIIASGTSLQLKEDKNVKKNYLGKEDK